MFTETRVEVGGWLLDGIEGDDMKKLDAVPNRVQNETRPSHERSLGIAGTARIRLSATGRTTRDAARRTKTACRQEPQSFGWTACGKRKNDRIICRETQPISCATIFCLAVLANLRDTENNRGGLDPSELTYCFFRMCFSHYTRKTSFAHILSPFSQPEACKSSFTMTAE